MTIDKFGRSTLRTRDKSQKGPKGDGFNLTPKGDYDIQNKRLCNLKRPSDDDDAVTKKFIVDSTLYKEKQYYDANQCLIRHLKSPSNSDDAATKNYVDEKSIPFTTEHYDMGNKILRHVNEGLEDSDAVNMKTLKAKTLLALKLVDNTYYDCQTKQLKNCLDPKDLQDVVNMNYIVRLLSQVLFDVYQNLGPGISMDKVKWIKKNVVNKYFLDEATRQFRNKEEEGEEEEETEIIDTDPVPYPNYLRTEAELNAQKTANTGQSTSNR